MCHGHNSWQASNWERHHQSIIHETCQLLRWMDWGKKIASASISMASRRQLVPDLWLAEAHEFWDILARNKLKCVEKIKEGGVGKGDLKGLNMLRKESVIILPGFLKTWWMLQQWRRGTSAKPHAIKSILMSLIVAWLPIELSLNLKWPRPSVKALQGFDVLDVSMKLWKQEFSGSMVNGSDEGTSPN